MSNKTNYLQSGSHFGLCWIFFDADTQTEIPRSKNYDWNQSNIPYNIV